MEPLNIRFGGGAAETAVHPIVFAVLVVSVVCILTVRFKNVVLPFLWTILLVPLGQVVVVGGIHFTIMRIVIVVGLVRCAISRRWAVAGNFNGIDKAFALWAVCYALAFSLLYMHTQALLNRLGFLIDALGGYFFLRIAVRNIDDARRIIKVLAFMSAVMAVCMINEQITRVNAFGWLGGVSAVPEIRSGRIRSQAVFQHSLIAGTFGATSLPLFLGLWRRRQNQRIAVTGIISAVIMVVTAAGSTPLLVCVAGVIGVCCWPVRHWVRAAHWAFLGMLMYLHLVMKAPVWALIGRIDLTGSSSAYHRYQLVDNFVRHFGDWWLIGTKNYDSWGFDMWDMSNQYVQYGARGGLLTMVLFVAMICLSFRKLGRVRRRASLPGEEWFLWCLTISLFTHVVAYFGISYFDQVQIVWYALLAVVSVYVLTHKPVGTTCNSSPLN